MTSQKRNYQTLTDDLFSLYDKIESGTLDLNKAKTMIKAASTINSIQRAKLIATQSTSTGKRVEFYED
ncbi:hypothetical protein [Flavobacterium phage FPSV-S29]|nr:hypothetical protein [Flavobacterium phage FPSV-S29]